MVDLEHSKSAEQSLDGHSAPALNHPFTERIAMTTVSQTQQPSLLSEFSAKYPVENQLWAAIQQDKHTAEDVQVAVAIAMAKDILHAY